MRAMILAAGRGTRLARLEPDVPKPLVRIGEHPILEHQLRFLAGLGVDQVVVNAYLSAFTMGMLTWADGDGERKLEEVVDEAFDALGQHEARRLSPAAPSAPPP